MTEKREFPSREELNSAFHELQDYITRISVEEEEEMVREQIKGKNETD